MTRNANDTQAVSAITKKLNEHDSHFEAIDRRFDAVDLRFDGIDKRIDKLSEEFHTFRIVQEDFGAKLDRVLDIKIQIHERLARYDRLEPKVEDHEHRISALEASVKRRSRKPSAPRQ